MKVVIHYNIFILYDDYSIKKSPLKKGRGENHPYLLLNEFRY